MTDAAAGLQAVTVGATVPTYSVYSTSWSANVKRYRGVDVEPPDAKNDRTDLPFTTFNSVAPYLRSVCHSSSPATTKFLSDHDPFSSVIPGPSRLNCPLDAAEPISPGQGKHNGISDKARFALDPLGPAALQG